MYSSFYLYIFPRVECRANSQNGRIWGWPAGSDSKRLHLPPCTNYCMSPNLHLLFLTTCNVFKVSSKYVFVRILRNSVHLQRDTFVHWGCWLGSVTTIVALAFVVAEVIPIFSYVLSLVGSVCYAPLAIMLPGWLWLHDHGHYLRGPSHRITESSYTAYTGLCFLWAGCSLLGQTTVLCSRSRKPMLMETLVCGYPPPSHYAKAFSIMCLSRWRLLMCR